MATKISEKKKSTPLPVSPVTTAPIGSPERLATDYLVTRIHQFLVSYGEPARLGDIAAGLSGENVTANLARVTLLQHPARFLQVDRRWDVRTRYLDRQRPTSKLLEEIVSTYDAPIAAWDAAHELGIVVNRSAEGSRPMTERLLKLSGTYAPLVQQGGEVKYGLASWLLDLHNYSNDEDLLFYNYLPSDAAAPYASVNIDWEGDPVTAVLALIAATPGPGAKVIDNRLVMFLAWKSLGEDFEPVEIFNELAASDKLIYLPNHRWTDETGITAIRAELHNLAEQVAELPEEEEAAAEESVPLTISPADVDEMSRIISASDTAVSASQLLEEIYDTTPGERTYAQDMETVVNMLKSLPERFLWVGYDRFRAAGSLPMYIGQIPESLQFPIVPQIPDANEDLFDQLIEDEGFERGLERDLRSAVAMDVGDQDPSETTLYPGGERAESRSVRLVLKSYHKEIGTFPLCQIPVGFLATEPQVIELTLRDTRGGEYQVFADYETQLIYGIGLFDLYSNIAADSGAVFSLERTATPGEFRFVNNNETDDNVYISPERMEQLQAYRAELEAGPAVPTFDIVKYVLEHSNSAMSYLNLLAEVNVVRRTTRRQLASIISSWTGFTQKGALWSFDPKKAASGFNKNKRKYVI